MLAVTVMMISQQNAPFFSFSPYTDLTTTLWAFPSPEILHTGWRFRKGSQV